MDKEEAIAEDVGQVIETTRPSTSSFTNGMPTTSDTTSIMERSISVDTSKSIESATTSTSTNLDVIETAENYRTSETLKHHQTFVKTTAGKISRMNQTPEDMNNIGNLGNRLKGYNGSKIHRRMSQHFVLRNQTSSESDDVRENSDPGKHFSLFDDAIGLQNVDTALESPPQTEPYLQIEPFHQKKFNPFTDKIGNQKDNVETMEPSKANVYKENWIGTIPSGLPETVDASFESFDYFGTSSVLKRFKDATSNKGSQHFSQGVWRWIFTLLIGPLTACVAVLIEESINGMTRFKYRKLSELLNNCYQDCSNNLLVPFLFSSGFNILCCIFAGLCIYLVPEAIGSGIPQIKCYLNGINMPKLVRLSTLISKVFGVVFSVSGGLPVGKEGPMIHSGGAIGASIAQGKWTSFNYQTPYFKMFRNNIEKRDFVASGTAAGVAAAFGSPLGGLLFVIEEGASHFDHEMLWRVAASACTSFFTLNYIKSALNPHTQTGELSNGGLINFGKFENASYNTWQLVVFAGMGVFGAGSGILFNGLNKRITQWRCQRLQNPKAKWFEVILNGFTVAAIAYVMSIIDTECENTDADIDKNRWQLGCKVGEENSAAALWYKTPEETVKALFHDKVSEFNLLTLGIFTLLYWLIACWTYGMSISSGLFVPSILIGAGWGRCVGLLLNKHVEFIEWGDVGKYALIGSVAQLAGVVRLSFSLTAIVMEATGNLTYLFPIFMVTAVAKHCGDFVNKGLYDIHIDLMGVPMMEEKSPIKDSFITAKHVMSRRIRVLPVRIKLKDIMDILRTTTHSAFPIVDTEYRNSDADMPSFGRLRGMIKRNEIISMICMKIFVNWKEVSESGHIVMSQSLNSRETGTQQLHKLYTTNIPPESDTSNTRTTSLSGHNECFDKLYELYPRYPTVEDLDLSLEDQNRYYLDFSLAMDVAPPRVSSSIGYPQIFEMFRKLGMRHVVVVNIQNEVVGMITRKNLVTLESEYHPYKEVKIKQKPIFFKGKLEKTEPIGIQRYTNKIKEKLGWFGCGGLSISMDAAGRLGFSNDNQRLVTNQDNSERSEYSSTLRNRRPFGSISSENDVPYVHIPYDNI